LALFVILVLDVVHYVLNSGLVDAAAIAVIVGELFGSRVHGAPAAAQLV